MDVATEVLIIGGGPAGSITAIELARVGHSVILLEQSLHEKSGRGETLPPKGNFLLRKLGLAERLSDDCHLHSMILRHKWGYSTVQEIDYSFHPYGGWIHLDRAKFNSALLREAMNCGVLVLENIQLQHVTANSNTNCQVIVSNGSCSHSLQCQFLVDATGRHSSVARLFGCRRLHVDKLVALVGFLRCTKVPDDFDPFIFIEPFEQGWWYSALFSDNRLVASVFTDPDLYPRDPSLRAAVWKAFLLRAPLTKRRLQGWQLDSVSASSASSSILSPLRGSKWTCVGDASSTFDPLSSKGIINAMESGTLAAQSIDSFLSGDESPLEEYSKTLNLQFEEYLDERSMYYSLEDRWSNSPFWFRRQKKAHVK